MKNLIQITTVLFLLVQTMSYSQTNEQEITLKKENIETTIDAKKFTGKYLLEEADFTLEIVHEDDKFYIISPFSKDLLTVKNESTLHEPSRGVDLEFIKDNKNALKYTQNGYETTIKRVE